MNTTLQPVLQPSTQTPTVPSPKSMHPQGSPMSYAQPSGPVSQNPYPNTNMAHSHTNAQQNHFNLSMSPGGYNMGSIPSSNHPVASLNQPTGVQQTFPAQKNASLPLHNVGHGQNQNTIPPVSQSLPANSVGPQQNQTNVPSVQSQNSPPVSTASVEHTAEKEKPQANGTPEKAVPPTELQGGNHVVPAVSDPLVSTAQITTDAPQKSPPRSQPPTPAPDAPKPPAEDAPPPSVPDAAPAPSPLREEPHAVTPPPKDAPAPEMDPLAIDTPPRAEGAAAPKGGEEGMEEVVEGEEEAVEQGPAKKEPPPAKAAPRTPARKAKVAKVEAKAEMKTPVQKSPSTGKVKRQRMMTQHYQSPLPEIEIITKISSSTPRNKNMDDKLIYFYKNEFLAVRNAEGSFYLCQAAQNVYKSSSKIKIRWLSQDKADSTGEIYTPDFYDLTDFDCILTSLDLTRVDKGKYRLKPAEKERTDSILKRCLAVEKGEIVSPSLSEEHPDGLDLSLYKDEEQLKKKRKGTKRKGRPRSASPKKKAAATPVKKAPEAAKVRKVAPAPAKPTAAARKAVAVPKAAAAAVGEGKKVVGRAARGKRRVDSKSPVMDQKKAIVLAKIGRSSAGQQAATSRTHSKSAKPTKPVPPTSKATKVSGSAASSSKATSLRKTKRSMRK